MTGPRTLLYIPHILPGGYWAPGTIFSGADVIVNSENNSALIYSYVNALPKWSTATANTTFGGYDVLPLPNISASPKAGSNSGNTSGGLLGGSSAQMGTAPGYKKSYCSHQGDLAALEDLLPGITRGDYVSTATKISVDTGAHLALEGAAASSVLKRAISTRTGIAMSTAEKLFERAALLLLLVSGEEALRAAHNEYQACMNY